MNILDMMNKLTALSQPLTEAKKPSTGNAFDLSKKGSDKSDSPGKSITHKGGVKTTDDKGVKHQGKYGNEYQGDDEDEAKNKAAKPAGAARGRGRPRKDAGADGETVKHDWSAFGAKKDVKLKPWDKAKTTKHNMDAGNKNQKKDLKDWIENLDRAINEDGQMTATPLPGATAIKNAQGQQVATAATPAAAAMMTKGDVTLTDPTKSLGEESGDLQYEMYLANGQTKRFMAPTKEEAVKKAKSCGATSLIRLSKNFRAVGKPMRPQEVNERDDREDDEHGGGPTPWENPDKGWTPPKKVSGPGAMAESKKKAKPDFLDKDKDGNKKEPFKKAVNDAKKVEEAKKAKPDFLDVDKDKNKKEPFKKAVKDAKKLDEISDTLAANTVKGRIQNNVKANDRANTVPQTKDSAARNAKAADATSAKLGKTYDAMGKRNARSVTEGKVKELDMDLKDPTMKDAEFKKKYGKGKAEMKASLTQKPDAKKPVSKVKESIIRESRETLQHIINKYKNEAKRFVAGEDLDQDLYDALYDYYCDQGEMPYGTMKARDGDPYEWVTQRFDQDVQDHDVPVDEGKYSQDYFTANKPSSVRQDAEIAKAPRTQTPWSTDPIAAMTDRISDKLSNPFGATPVKSVQFESWDNQLNSLLAEGMNVVANTGLGDAPDSVTISATEHDAAALLSLVKSAGLGMFASDEQGEQSQAMSVATPDGGEPSADIDVVDDHDGMLSLIRKMTGQGERPVHASGPGEQEVDEESCQGCAEGNCQQHGDAVVDEGEGTSSEEEVQQATEKLEKIHDVWSDAGDEEVEQDEPADEVNVDEEEGDDAAEEETDDVEEGAEEEEDKEEVEESFANDADDTFESDIDFMQNVISGGVNGRKRTQSVGSPVTIASTPMRESTDLLKDWVKLSGLK